ncbi:MarR family transcriptional regulator [Amphritea sp. 1_MG-2023]|uniref:MarR family winged helix-turn-helix transcriptional regulator n=1 Tax=Amphritea sp. 1_MG-2023 TaxID=3062670 RepID=UPI0026E1A357|nr:MarR family transcriptional regulator [Amphritea sp. 1_MG-2023]MDO6563961.1 MarR family transcriptional regulator [Amphritea sp. 1_MG-2023]
MTDKLPCWQDVLIELRKINRATDLQSKRVVKACGLTIPQVMVLQAIKDLGDVTVKKISDNVSLSQATVSTIMNRLEERQLVQRLRSHTDRRIVNARLTPAGEGIFLTVPTLLHESFINRFEHLTAAEQQHILDALKQISGMMDAEAYDADSLLALSEAKHEYN